MKRLFLVRHGKSSWSHSDLPDFERPLKQRGERDAPEMGRRLAAQCLRPGRIVSSPARRAIDTAHLLAGAMGAPAKAILADERIYGAGVRTLVEVITSLQAGLRSAMLVGHNPGLTDLVHVLTGTDVGNVPTCGVVRIEFQVAWADVVPGAGELVSFDYPKRPSETG